MIGVSSIYRTGHVNPRLRCTGSAEPPPLTAHTAEFWGIAEPGGGTEPTDPLTEEPAGECVTANNCTHVAAGRAEHRQGNAYALGSGDALGLWNVAVTTSLPEAAPDHWELTPGGC